VKRIRAAIARLREAFAPESIKNFHLTHAGNLVPATLAVIFAFFLVLSALGWEESRVLTYVAAGVGIAFSLAALRRMGRHPSGWPTLLVLIFFWAKAILGMIYVALTLVALELFIIGTNHIGDNAIVGLLASVSVMQLILGLFLYYGANHGILGKRVDPGILLRWVFRCGEPSATLLP
jgi:hypothetical protein